MEKETIMFLDAMHQGLTITDSSGKLIYINDSAAELFGIDKIKAIGKPVEVYEESGAFAPSITKMVMEQGKTVKATQSDINGREILGTGIPVYDDGELKYIVCFSAWDLFTPDDIKKRYEILKADNDRLEREIKSLRKANEFNDEIVAESRIMQDNVKLLTKIRDVNTPVFIWGPEGCGKKTIAKALHKIGKYSNEALEIINCSIFSDEIMEVTLFGNNENKGIIDNIGMGMLIIENIEFMSKAIQLKMKNAIKKSKMRVVALSVFSLEHLHNEGKIISELYHLLSVINVEIPCLQERLEDLKKYINMYLDKYNVKYSRNVALTPKAYNALFKYRWKDNVSQVKAVIERIVLTSDCDKVEVYDLPKEISVNSRENFSEKFNLKNEVEAFEKGIIIHAYDKYKTTVAIADALGISQASAVRRLQKYIEGYKQPY